MRIQKLPVGMMAANCYIISDEQTKDAVILDPGGEPHKIENYITSNELNVVAILLTHGHMDHIEGAEPLRNKYKCDIYGHMDDEDMFENPKLNLSDRYNGHSISFKVDMYVADGENLNLGSLKFKAIHTPGHTKGGVSYLVKDKLFSGDTLFNASIGRTDLYGGDSNTIVDSIRKKIFLLSDETEVLPGHGPKTTVGIEKKHNPFLK